MARAKTVWGIDIGQCALKALKLREVDGRLRVEALDVIEHPRILSEPDVDRDQLIKEALQKFLDHHTVSGCHVAVSVPGQSTFSRFVKLPPVESKRIPDIVRFEAEQQIPFPINEVVWQWQTFRDPDSPDIEVGIFAMKRSDVAEILHHFQAVDLRVDTVQMAPLALYNFMAFDEQLASDGATLLADVGVDKADLVVADRGRVWTRTIQIGGSNFTEALVKTFKLSFDKAEQHKRTAASSKYARQIFQAMRPVFADLVQEMQRSIGFYSSLHRDTRFRKLIGLGNGFRLPGLQKFIEQNLNIPVTRIDSYNKLSPSPAVNVPALNENVLSFAVAYGLAVQGMAKAGVSTNLLPGEIVRHRVWGRKRPWFAAAALAVVAALFCPGYRANLDSKTLQEDRDLRAARKIASDLDSRIREYEGIKDQGIQEDRQIRELAGLLGYRDFWPAMLTVIYRSIEAMALDQPLLADYGRYLELKELYERQYGEILAGKDDRGQPVVEQDLDIAAGVLLDDAAHVNFKQRLTGSSSRAMKALAKSIIGKTQDALDPNAVEGLSDDALRVQLKRLLLVEKIKQVEAFKAAPRNTRRVLILEALNPSYMPDLGGRRGVPVPAGLEGKKGFQVEMVLRTPLPQMEANKMAADLRLQATALARWVSSLSVLAHAFELAQAGSDTRGPRTTADGRPSLPDPLMPDEDMASDIRFRIYLWVGVDGDGIVAADIRMGRRYSLEQATDLMPDLDPTNAISSAERIQSLPAGTLVTVEGSETKWTVPWYRVRATDPSGKVLGAGWINGAAFKAAEVKEGEAP